MSINAGLVPWVQNSHETIHHEKITKRVPKELRMALVRVVMGVRRCNLTVSWRFMERYVEIKNNKGIGESIIAIARKLSEIIWCMLSAEEECRPVLMIDKKLLRKAETMRSASKKSA